MCDKDNCDLSPSAKRVTLAFVYAVVTHRVCKYVLAMGIKLLIELESGYTGMGEIGQRLHESCRWQVHATWESGP